MPAKSIRMVVIVVMVLAALLRPSPAARPAGAQSAGTTTRVSVASDGTQGNGNSWNPYISADGRYVAFQSTASNLVDEETTGVQHIYLHDTETGLTERISEAIDGAEGNDESEFPSISGNGRFVTFQSYASNLVNTDTNSQQDIFVHDRQTRITEKVSISSNGEEANSGSTQPFISLDGRYVAFSSFASNLVDGDTNGTWDIFVHDRQTGQTGRVTVATNGTQANHSSYHPSISADGRYIVFESYASNLVSGDTNNCADIFIRDLFLNITTRVSVSSSGIQTYGGESFNPSISSNGRFVAFQSFGDNLVSGDTNGVSDIFVHDRKTEETVRVSMASNGDQANNLSDKPSISANGRYIVFYSSSNNLVSGDTNGYSDIFIHDRKTGLTELISLALDDKLRNGDSTDPYISSNGDFIVFYSYSDNLVFGDNNGSLDVFLTWHPTDLTLLIYLPFVESE